MLMNGPKSVLDWDYTMKTSFVECKYCRFLPPMKVLSEHMYNHKEGNAPSFTRMRIVAFNT